jgi:hypothetical protein
MKRTGFVNLIRGTKPTVPRASEDGFAKVHQHAQAAESLLAKRFDKQTVDRAKKLLDQQFWLWGQDVARLSNNGLIEIGFKRHAPPIGLQTNSCYILEGARGQHIGLWGFGAFYGQTGVGGSFLKRYSFGLCLTNDVERPSPCWGFDQLPEHRAPTSLGDRLLMHRLLDGFLGWVTEYERWIEGFAPPLHRAECLRDWKKRYWVVS